MPFPDLSDKRLPLEKQSNDGSNTYREKVREKLLNSPRSGQSIRQSIDLSLTRENTFFRPPSRLRVSSGKIESYDPTNLRQKSSLIRERQIIRYNKTYVPSAFDSSSTNDEEIRIQDEEDLEKSRASVSRPASRESFYQEDEFKMRTKSSRRNQKNISNNKLSNENENLNFEHTLTKSVNLFNSSSNINTNDQYPIPKPRKRDTILEYEKNKSNIINDLGDFRIKKGNQINLNKVVTPRTGYIPTPTPRNIRNQNEIESLNPNNSFLSNLDLSNSFNESLTNRNEKENDVNRPKTSRSRSLNKINMTASNSNFLPNDSRGLNSQVLMKKDSTRMNY